MAYTTDQLNQALLSLQGQNKYTSLNPYEEQYFQTWKKIHNVPFADTGLDDYDMRGYFKEQVLSNKNLTNVNPIDNQIHYPDTYKQPTHQSFSRESKYWEPGMNEREWINNILIDYTLGKVIDNAAMGRLFK